MPRKKDLKGIRKTKRKNTPSITKIAAHERGHNDAMARMPLYIVQDPRFPSSKSCPSVEFQDMDEIVYHDKYLDCLTLLQRWMQTIISNSLCFLSEHQKLVIEEVILKSTPALEVAKKLKKSKTTISHSLYGIYVPEYNTFHGGSLKKLRSIVEKSPEFKNYIKLKRIINSKPSETYLDFFLESSKDRKFSFTLSEFLLMKYATLEVKSNDINTRAIEKDS